MIVNSYRNFLKFLLKQGLGAAEVLAKLKAEHGAAMANAKPVGADGEDTNAENQLRGTIGRSAWTNDDLRKLFAAAQPSLPDLYNPPAVVAAAPVGEVLFTAAAEVPSILSLGEFIAWGRKHIGLVIVIGDAAAQLPGAANFVERWEIVKPVGDAVAPAIDDLLTDGVFHTNEQAESLEAELLASVSAAAAQSGEFGAAAARDGRWLRAGMELFKILLPILLAAR